MGDADFVHPLRRGSRSVSGSNLEGQEAGQDNDVEQVSEGEDGRKIVEARERNRVDVFCGKCGNMRDMSLG